MGMQGGKKWRVGGNNLYLYSTSLFCYQSSNSVVLTLTVFFMVDRPKSGSMLLYSRKKVRYRRDGYCWKKRKDGKTTREDHMKLKVQGTEVCEMFCCIP